MTELAKHIENLLFKNECVIVPQLGGFVTHYVPAHYNQTEGLYMPPSRSIGFNPQLQLNDGLLVQSYMQANDISFPEAVQQLESDVNQLKQQLQSQGACQLQGIGRLTLGLNGKYAFEPDSRGIVAPQLYAMEPLSAVPLTSTAKKQTPRQQQRPPYTISINRRLADACIAALVALIVYFAWANDITTPQATTQASLSSSFVFLPPTHHRSALSAVPPRTAPDTTTIATPDTASVSTLAPTCSDTIPGPYSIVLASSITLPNARHYVNQLQQQGFNGAYVQTTPRMVRVLYNHYPTADQAQRALNRLRNSDSHFHDAWVIRTQS